jgi:hypothetical protein
MFIDTARIVNNPAYSISATYPLNDNTGYSKFKVPNTPFCLPVNQTSVGTCPDIDFMYYNGVMLGDADGDVATLSGTLQNRPSGDKVIIDLTKAIFNGNSVEVPVTFESSVPVTGVDFALMFDESNLTYNTIVNYPSNSDALAYFNPNDKTLRFTSSNVDLSVYATGSPVVSIRFESVDGKVDESQFNAILGQLNGQQVSIEVLGKTVGINTNSGDNSVSIFPNPTNGILNVTSFSDATVQMFDITGKEIVLETSVNASKTKQINVTEFANGVYFVKIFNNDFITIKKVVLSK